jgi:hypothetical protein
MAFQFRQSGAQQILEIVSRLQLFTVFVGLHRLFSLELAASTAILRRHAEWTRGRS